MAAQAVATAGLNNSISTPTDYSTESRGDCGRIGFVVGTCSGSLFTDLLFLFDHSFLSHAKWKPWHNYQMPIVCIVKRVAVSHSGECTCKRNKIVCLVICGQFWCGLWCFDCIMKSCSIHEDKKKKKVAIHIESDYIGRQMILLLMLTIFLFIMLYYHYFYYYYIFTVCQVCLTQAVVKQQIRRKHRKRQILRISSHYWVWLH